MDILRNKEEKDMRKLFAVCLVSMIFWCNISVHGESVQDRIAKERIKLACNVQLLPLTTQIFDECIKENGMPYNLRQIFAPCSKIAGMNLKTYAGIFNFTCKEQGNKCTYLVAEALANEASAKAKEAWEKSVAESKKAWEKSMKNMKEMNDKAMKSFKSG